MASENASVVVGLGEVLWDLFPEGKQLGGAPANFAYHAQALGARGLAVSCMGDDELGRAIVEQLTARGLDMRYVAVDSGIRRGRCR
jgi:fructokinase